MRRSISLARRPGVVLWTNDLGEFLFLNKDESVALSANKLTPDQTRYLDVEARGMLSPVGPAGGLADTVRRTRKSFLMEGPSLHIFVVTLRCDHSCQYCQVSRVAVNASGFDMSREDAVLALDRVFESDAPALTIEFQGGEPALRFDLIREVVAQAAAHPARSGRPIHFTMATTLQLLSDDDLGFCRDHAIHLSTSIDGPALLHATQRPTPSGNSWKRTIDALARARDIVGHDGVAALPTITRTALSQPKPVVDTYVELGFRSIFLRPLAPYGFARKTQRSLGYSTTEFMSFYETALNHILDLNKRGIAIEETTAAIMLRHMLTPFHSGYMDLRSPTGAGLGTLVYNYDGRVYPSDEARMAAETGDQRFVLGSVADDLDTLLGSDAMKWLARGAIAEKQPDCLDCAFVPYCGADPVHHAITQGEPDAPRHGSGFCEKNMALFHLLFAMLTKRDHDTMRTFAAWAMSRERDTVQPGWIEQ
ncbi:MAG: His-Xaa-Ser system radical SAM maturase HxsB [Hyphomonadaceae bacterium]|nr:His-Xaa-Ser system radical SAM maturase HxsB [Hyphomonadaceae bacterium]